MADSDGDADDRYSNKTTSRIVRTIQYSEQAHRIESQARRQDGKVKDRIDFMFTTNAWPRYRCWYYQRDTSSSSFFKYRVGIAGVYEFVGETFTIANVVSKIHLADRLPSEWSSMIPGTDVTNPDGSTYKKYSTSISGKLLQASASVTLTARMASGFGAARDPSGNISVYLGANILKYDVLIDNWQYQQPVGSSRLAVVTVAQSIGARTRHHDGNDTDDAYDIGNGGSFMWFNRAWHSFKNGSSGWQDITTSLSSTDISAEYQTTQTDEDADASETTDVIIHILEGSDQHPDSIEWDPATMIAETGAAGARSPLAWMMVAVAMLVSSLLIVF